MYNARKIACSSGMLLAMGALAFSNTALAADAPPQKDAPQKTGEASKDKKWELGVTAASLGAFDSNIFDKGKDPVKAAGGDVNIGLTFGVPLGSSLAWASGAGVGTNARQGIGG